MNMDTMQMTEKEYCVANIEKNFNKLKEKRIALYGTGINARVMLAQMKDYNVVCLIDDKQNDCFVDQNYVVTLGNAFLLDLDAIIIAANIGSTAVVYKRICEQCLSHGVAVYDMYGNDYVQLYKNSISQIISYTTKELEDIKQEIDNHQVISFDLVGVAFACRHNDARDRLVSLEKGLNNKGFRCEKFASTIEGRYKKEPFLSVTELVEEVAHVDKQIINGIVADEFAIRQDFYELYHYAIDNNKTVCFVADIAKFQLKTSEILELLKRVGIEQVGGVFNSLEYHRNKTSGLYRALKEKYQGKQCLHIGSTLVGDVIAPAVYGLTATLVYSPMDMNEIWGKVTPKAHYMEEDRFRQALDKFVLDAFKDKYFIHKVELSNNALIYERRLEAIKWQLDSNEEAITYSPILFDFIDSRDNTNEFEKIEFEPQEHPEISIVIPVYNQFEFTYNCLKSIKEYSEGISYEVIVADDCSTDFTKQLEEVAVGARVIHNKENLRFLLNCNNAAEHARGKYILFLNNDTQVQPNWLKWLLDSIEKDESVGMIGSKLVYPDGRLQEAGGILWRDGSAWNYGHLQNPEAPEYSYYKEADYISGAAIMIRTELWKEIGGFDERFVPAYYEDTDLAFEVRKHGYKVCLQPQSIVVHFEGISNGTDTSTGLKAYQVANQKKFYDKWKEVLEKDHFDNAQHVYLAKDRGQTKKQILVVDHYVPNFDKDAGGRCTYMYIKMFLKMGMKVTFIGDNFAKLQPYTDILNGLGVEILYGNFYYNNWENWLRENAHYFDYIYLQRPHISIKYIDIVKQYSKAKIFYFAHDLHHVRLQREYELSGDEKTLEEANKWKKVELELFEKTDVGHVVGSYEQEVMQKVFPDKPIRDIPLYIYENEATDIEKDFSKRKDILFVGGFGHTPNIDAVLWFAENVFPKILEKNPTIMWHIVGSKAPDEVKNLANDHIILEGFVSDEKLAELYRECRMVVVPLRYGAGVKGKVVEAAYYQIPIVTTSIGGEGIDDSVGAFTMVDDAEGMAELVNNLYNDFDRLKEMSDAGRRLVNKCYDVNAAENVLRKDIDL